MMRLPEDDWHGFKLLVNIRMTVLRPRFPDHGSPFSRRQERARKTAAIRSAAAQRFNTQGVRGTRLEDIAADLGLTKTSIAYYYPSKDKLAEAVFLTAAEFLEEAVVQAEETDAEADLKILTLFRSFVDQLTDALEGQRSHPAQLQELDTLPSDMQARIVTRLSAAVGRVDTIVQEWLDQTDQALGRSEPVTFCLFALLDWLKVSANDMSGADFRKASAVLLDILSGGLARRGALTGQVTPQFNTRDELPQIFDREARNQVKREAFLKAGIRYFNLYGFEGVSLADVAGSLGVTRGAFYYHIPDKESFLEQCLDHSLDAVEATLGAAEEIHDGLDFIRRVLFDLIYMQASGVTPIIRPGLMSALPPARQKRYRARLRNISRRLGDAHDAAIAGGMAYQHDTATVEAILASVMFLNDGYTLAAANSFNDWRISEHPQSATNDYLHGLLYGLTAAAR